MQPDVSIIMPVYNVQDYLQQSLHSVSRQSLKNIEIICVNDGSTDRSSAILEHFAEKDNRIKVITTDNYGYGHAMNIGVSTAKGKYVGIVEPDDYILPDMFEYLFDAACISNADIIKSDFYRFTENNGVKNKFFQPAVSDKQYYCKKLDPKENKICFQFIMNIWCGIYRKDMIDKYGINFNETEGASFQDNGFWFKTLCYAKSVLYLNKAFYMNRRDNPNSSVNQKNNIYACNKEYRYIRGFLTDHPELEQNFLDVYSYKKYQTYMFNLNRISGELAEKYICLMSDEWRTDKKKGELQEEWFSPDEWREISVIMNCPEQYVEEFFVRSKKERSYMEGSISLEEQLANRQYEIEEIRKSISYRIGMFSTWLPRKIRDLFQNRNT